MKTLEILAGRIRRGDPIPFPLAVLLNSVTPLTRLAMNRRLNAPRISVEARVISFGNITAGGTGKTPAVIERACREAAAGKKVAILTRGYGAQPHAGLLVARAEDKSAAHRIGDEPALILRHVPQAIIVRSPDRVAAARHAIEQEACDTLILDDGFQYVRLVRDENILLIDASNPFGNRCLIPRGILREPLDHMSRATSIILTRCDQARDMDGLVDTIEQICPGLPIRKTRHAPTNLWSVSDGSSVPLDTLKGASVRAVCAIGNPEAFVATLESLGARITERVILPDHGAIPAPALDGPGSIIVTEKDAMRLVNPPANVLALGIALKELEP